MVIFRGRNIRIPEDIFKYRREYIIASDFYIEDFDLYPYVTVRVVIVCAVSSKWRYVFGLCTSVKDWWSFSPESMKVPFTLIVTFY